MKRKYLIGLDTETCNGMEIDGTLDLSQSLVYDIGWAVVDKQGRIYRERSFIIYEIFVGMSDVMKSAYYANKIPMYWEDIENKERKLVRFDTMLYTFLKDCKEFGIDTAFAHNASFDLRALNNTIRLLTNSKRRYFFPKKMVLWDTLKMARQTIGRQKSYRSWCLRNDYMTKHATPQPRLTAEIIYRYISGNNNFIENHTGLEDVIIETKIMAHCLRQHKKMVKELYPPIDK